MLSLLTITEGVWDLFVNSSCSCFQCFLHNPTKHSEPGEEHHETQHCWLSDEAFMSHMSLQGMFLLRLWAHIDTDCHHHRRWKYIAFKASSSLWEQHSSLPKWLLSHVTGGGQVWGRPKTFSKEKCSFVLFFTFLLVLTQCTHLE